MPLVRTDDVFYTSVALLVSDAVHCTRLIDYMTKLEQLSQVHLRPVARWQTTVNRFIEFFNNISFVYCRRDICIVNVLYLAGSWLTALLLGLRGFGFSK